MATTEDNDWQNTSQTSVVGGSNNASTVIPNSIPASTTGTASVSDTDNGFGDGAWTAAGSTYLTHIVPGATAGMSQANVTDYAGITAQDPYAGMSNEMILSNKVPTYNDAEIAAGTVNQQAPMDAAQYDAGTNVVNQTATANVVDPRQAVSYDAQTSYDQVAQNDMQAAQGTVSQGSQVNIEEIDTEATGQGLNEVGKALNAAAVLDLNDIDSRATLKGQIDILQDEFVDGDGNPTIPPWASGLARQVSKIAAFTGITGTAATEAMANALLESSISIAKEDAKFFQTVSLQNLSNQQQSVINKANVLANMDLANLDARTTAAVENAKNFMQMDLANLNNEQQAELINTQQRVQSILEDSKAANAARLFEAESENDMAKFYDTLNSTIQQYNASQLNAMAQFNAGELNSTAQFNAEMQNQRDQFYRNMQYNIDVANAEWRQKIATDENQKEFEALAFDVKNAVDISQESLNQIWDRSDALLDYIWKSAENELDRDRAILIAQIGAQAGIDQASISAEANKTGILDVVGAVAGKLLGSWLG